MQIRLTKKTLSFLSEGPVRGMLEHVFPRLKISQLKIPCVLKQQVMVAKAQWLSIFPTHTLTLAKICHVIKSELSLQKKHLSPRDICIDWGCGAGKWVIF